MRTGIILVSLLTAVSFFVGPVASQQAPSAPSVSPGSWSYPLRTATHSEPPLIGDYVPCIFDMSDHAVFRAIAMPSVDKDMRESAQSVLDSVDLPTAVKNDARASLNTTYFPSQSAEDIYSTLKVVLQKSLTKAQQSTEKGGRKPEDIDTTAQKIARNIADAAIQSGPIQRPPDVSCGIAVLPWSVSRWTFGREIAENFIAVQVTVRNLNETQQFLVHDVELAVDTQPGVFDRFSSGIDQTTVHGVAASAEEGVDSRTFWLRLATFVGSITSAATVAISADAFRQAVGVYQGGFIPGLNKFVKDHTEEQISRLDAEAFTTAQAKKVIVPKSDSATFYTFLASKPVQQVDWELIYKIKTGTTPFTPTMNFVLSKEVAFKKWTPVAFDGFRNSTYVILSGAHIKEVTNPKISSVSCPPGNDNKIDLSKISGETLTCTIKGTDLDLVSRVILENATDASDKVFANGTVEGLKGGDTTQAQVTFTIKDLASLKGTTYKLFFSTQGGNPQSSNVTVTLEHSVVSVAPSSLTFSSAINKDSPAQTSKLTNNGTKDLTIKSTQKTGKDSSDFNVDSDCMKKPLKTGEYCTITVTFSPKTEGDKSASVSIEDDAADSPQTLALTGKTESAGTSALKVSASSLTFSAQKVGTSASKSIELTNEGTPAVTIKPVKKTGKDAADFNPTNNCKTPLKKGDSCKITVTFSPHQAGGREASISIESDAPGSPQTVELKGTGEAAPKPLAKLSAKTVPFGAQKLNSATIKKVTLTNDGDAALTIKSINVTGFSPSDFLPTEKCGKALAPKSTCEMDITFKPTTIGDKSAVIVIEDDAIGSPHTVNLTGKGL